MALINDFMSLIYPRLCEACGVNLFGHEKHLCNLCKVNLRRSNYHLSENNPISHLFAGRIPIKQASSFLLFEKNGKVQNILHSIKYNGNKELAFLMGILYAEELTRDTAFTEITAIIPIPLHTAKLKQRGFNQSEYFASGLSKGLSKPIHTSSLLRVKESSTQTSKRKFERWENVEGIFELVKQEELKGQHVLLVDDVITTGATLESAWTSLKAVDDLSISIASIAFAENR